jgi:hypothetical protein
VGTKFEQKVSNLNEKGGSEMKRLTKIALSMLVIVILTGCGKKIQAPQLTDEDAIREYILENAEGWFNVFDPISDSLQDDSTPSGIMTYTVEGDTFNFVRAWGRELIDRFVDIYIHIHNDTADVEINATLEGILHVAGPDTVVNKDFVDYGLRFARFVRTGSPDVHNGWVLDAISMMRIQPEEYTVWIDSVRVTGGDIDTVITDPLELWTRDDILAFPPGTPVTVSLYVNDPVNTLAYLHYNTPNHHHRRSPRFIYRPEDGALVGTWRTPLIPGRYRAGVDILNWATLYVPDYPYDSGAWCFVYRVVQ